MEGSSFLMKNESQPRRSIKNKAKDIVIFAYKIVFYLIGLLPKRKNLIMFESYLGKQYSCNPRAIYEYLKFHYPEFKMYWSIDPKYSDNFRNKDVIVVPRFSIKWLFLMANAKYWVSNSRLPNWLPKPRKTIYLQTWHGTPLKRLALDMKEVHIRGMDNEEYKEEFLKDSRKWDYLISPNAYSSKIFRRAFQFNKTMIESGYPRNDFLYTSNNEKMISTLKKRFNLPKEKKVILYAPTWRDDQYTATGYKFKLELEIGKMKEVLGKNYCLILRLHYLVAQNIDLSEFEGFAFDYSNHEDIRELYLVSDILITDYSSVFFDYANLKRPMIFFVYDIEDYRERLRGFYFDFEELAPGPLVKTTHEVIEAIQQFEENENQLPDQFNSFYHTFCNWENGTSTKKVVEQVFDNH